MRIFFYQSLAPRCAVLQIYFCVFFSIWKQVFKFICAPTLESVIWRCAQSNMEGTVEVTDAPYSYFASSGTDAARPTWAFWHWCSGGAVCVFVCSTEENTSQESCSLCVGLWEMPMNNLLQSTGTCEVEEVVYWKCLPCIWLFLYRRWAPRVLHLPTSFLWEKNLTLRFPFHSYAVHCVKYQVNMVAKSLICCMF